MSQPPASPPSSMMTLRIPDELLEEIDRAIAASPAWTRSEALLFVLTQGLSAMGGRVVLPPKLH